MYPFTLRRDYACTGIISWCNHFNERPTLKRKEVLTNTNFSLVDCLT